MKDYLLIATAYNDEARIYICLSTNLVERSRKIHKTYKTSTAALGRLLTAGAMMSLMSDEDARLTLKIDGDGPASPITVVAKKGLVKGYINNPKINITYENGPNKGKLNVGEAVGRGLLYVTRDINGNFYTSSSNLVSGEIALDLTYYFAESEQVPSSVGLGVLTTQNKVIQAGGFIIQLMPFATEETVVSLEKILKETNSITSLLENGETPETILSLLANKTEKILSKEEIKYHCDCSKDKFKKALLKLDKKALEDILYEDKQAEIVCEYCNKKYLFNEDELKEIIKFKKT